MLENFLTSLIFEITNHLSKNGKNKLDDFKAPKQIKEYLKKCTDDELIKDIANTIEYLKDPIKTRISENGLLIAASDFLTSTFINDIYKLPIVFYKHSRNIQEEAVTKIIKSESLLANSLKRMIVNTSYQEILEGITKFAQATSGAPYIVVQSPIELNPEKKIEIKDKLQEKHSNCSPIFQINKNLIGGLRIFIDGKVEDFSWLGRINYITSINIR